MCEDLKPSLGLNIKVFVFFFKKSEQVTSHPIRALQRLGHAGSYYNLKDG